jgi:hypothetical protein
VNDTAYERHLERAHSLMSRRVRAGAAGLAAEIAAAPVPHSTLRVLRGEAANAIARQHAEFAAAFDEALLHAFAEFTQPPAAKAAGQWLDLGAFEIMDESRIQDEIEVAQFVRILGEECEGELRRLLRFEASLEGHGAGRAAASPIGPPSLARALWTASEGLGLSAPVRAELVRSMTHWLAPRLDEVYATLRQAGAAEAPAPEAADLALDIPDASDDATPPTNFDVTRPGALFELIDLDAQGPVFEASMAAPLGPSADTQAMPLDGEDARVPGLIHSHREELTALQDATSARLGVALIGHLFVQIVADPVLSNEAREWIARLQPAVVRLATHDATLLQSHRHPAWTLVNRIVTHLRADKEAPPPEFLQWLAQSVAHVLQEPSTETFQAAIDRLGQWQRQQAQRRLTSVEGPLDLLRRNASLEELVGQARARLQRKLDSAQPPSQTKRFILTLWSLVAAQEWAALAPEMRRNSAAMDAAGDLIWSTDAERSRADEPTLAAMIPGLMERLVAGLATVKLSEAMKKVWLDQIAALHLQAMRRPLGAEAASGPVTVDLQLEDVLPPEPLAALAAAPAAASPLENLQVGDSVAMQLDGEWTELQLLWTSDNGYFLLFAGSGAASRSFTRKALDRMVAQGLLRSADANSALQRASDKILRARQ